MRIWHGKGRVSVGVLFVDEDYIQYRLNSGSNDEEYQNIYSRMTVLGNLISRMLDYMYLAVCVRRLEQ